MKKKGSYLEQREIFVCLFVCLLALKFNAFLTINEHFFAISDKTIAILRSFVGPFSDLDKWGIPFYRFL